MATQEFTIESIDSISQEGYMISKETTFIRINIENDNDVKRIEINKGTPFFSSDQRTSFTVISRKCEYMQFCLKGGGIFCFSIRLYDLSNCGLTTFSNISNSDPYHSELQMRIVAQIANSCGRYRITSSGQQRQKKWFEDFCRIYKYKLLPVHYSGNINSGNLIGIFDLIPEFLNLDDSSIRRVCISYDKEDRIKGIGLEYDKINKSSKFSSIMRKPFKYKKEEEEVKNQVKEELF